MRNKVNTIVKSSFQILNNQLENYLTIVLKTKFVTKMEYNYKNKQISSNTHLFKLNIYKKKKKFQQI